MVAAAMLVAALAGTAIVLAASSPAPEAPAPKTTPATEPARAADPDPEYAALLRSAIRRLNARREARRVRLAAARTRPGQERIATQLADAYEIAARAQARAPRTAGSLEPNRAIVAGLRRTERGYRLMARGSRTNNRSDYVRGRDMVRRREPILQERLRALARLGYRIR